MLRELPAIFAMIICCKWLDSPVILLPRQCELPFEFKLTSCIELGSDELIFSEMV